MHTVSGEIETGEASRAARAISARQRGSALLLLIPALLCLGGGAVLGEVAGETYDAATSGHISDTPWPWLAGLLLGWIPYLWLTRVWTVHGFRRRMSSRGLDLRFPCSFTVSDEGLATDTGVVRSLADWSGVTEIFRVTDYWIFMVQMSPWILPVRYFNGETEEKAFLSAALAHMTEDARARSGHAAVYART